LIPALIFSFFFSTLKYNSDRRHDIKVIFLADRPDAGRAQGIIHFYCDFFVIDVLQYF
jgi:hypothetical protein